MRERERSFLGLRERERFLPVLGVDGKTRMKNKSRPPLICIIAAARLLGGLKKNLSTN